MIRLVFALTEAVPKTLSVARSVSLPGGLSFAKSVSLSAAVSACLLLLPISSAQQTPPAIGGTGAPQVGQGEVLLEDIVAWVNDEVVLLSDYQERVQIMNQQLMQRYSGEDLSAAITQANSEALLEMISARMMIQKLESLIDMDAVRLDQIKQFMAENNIADENELSRMLARETSFDVQSLGDMLVSNFAPRYAMQLLVEPNVEITPADTQAYYDANIDKFSTEGSVTFRELVLTAESKRLRRERASEAQALAASAKELGAAEFTDFLREHSEAPSKAIDGKIGPINPADLIGDVRDVVLKTPVGAVSEAFETDGGWHVVLVEERVEQEIQPFEEVQEVCAQAIRAERFPAEYAKFLEGLWDDSVVEVRESYVAWLPQAWQGRVDKIR